MDFVQNAQYVEFFKGPSPRRKTITSFLSSSHSPIRVLGARDVFRTVFLILLQQSLSCF